MSGEQGWEGTERFSRGCNAQSLPPLLVLYRIPFPSSGDSMPQRLRPVSPYFVRLLVKPEVSTLKSLSGPCLVRKIDLITLGLQDFDYVFQS